jgi:hypothetical protein
MEISDRIHIRMTVHGFWPTVYMRCTGLNAKAKFIIEACHMPGTVVGCHSLCLGTCLTRGVVLQLFIHRPTIGYFQHLALL